MKSVHLSRIRTALLVASDALCSAAAFVAGYHLRCAIDFPNPAEGPLPLQSYFLMIAIQSLFIIMIFFFYRLYHLPRAHSFFNELYMVFGSVSVGFMMALAITIVSIKNTDISFNFSRGMLIYAWVSSIIFIMASRTVIHWLFRKLRSAGIGRDRILIVGFGDVARMIMQKIRSRPSIAGEVAGLVVRERNGPYVPKEIEGVPVLGCIEELPRLITENRVDEIIIALPEVSHGETLGIIGLCDRSETRIRVFPDTFLFIAGQVSIEDLGGLPLLSLRDVAMRGWRLAVKRLFDIIMSFSGLVLLSPLFLVVAVLIKIESRGPVFYAQERMGLDGKPFHMLKFRSMRIDAEKEGPGWTKPGDPRRTRVGAVIRRLNIDEMPQLINVFAGRMSLVGPRAERPCYVEQFRKSIPGYLHRHREKAGMTGWAQVNGLRGDTSIEERTKYDLWYVENWSLLLDFKILVRQFFQLFNSRNAY
ncbi:MAG: undecaprenyl-phosphate glucose phosphotransferase [Chitinispirillaceae bacterium]|nr:undecaprenyl-phosphate glucose phosphotransferase [Chitinispirillaceae bacterium]